MSEDTYPGGAPTKYKPEYSGRDYIEGYMSQCEEKNELVSICGFACYVGVTEKTLHNWSEKSTEFLRTLGYIKQMSKQMLMNKGLNKKYNPLIAKLCLSANHGMKEKTDITTNDESITIALPKKLSDI